MTMMMRTLKRPASKRRGRGRDRVRNLLHRVLRDAVRRNLTQSILGYTSSSLHAAVESAARCRAMGTTCTDAATTQTFAAAKFHNLTGNTATFTSTTSRLWKPGDCDDELRSEVHHLPAHRGTVRRGLLPGAIGVGELVVLRRVEAPNFDRERSELRNRRALTL